MNRRSATAITLGLALAAIVAWLAVPRPAAPAEPQTRTAPRGVAGAGGPAAPPSPIRLVAGARVRFLLLYAGCGIQRAGTGPLPPGLVGMTRREVAAQFATAAIVQMTPELLVLERREEGCPDDSVTLADRGGRVVALAGRPGDLGPVIARSDLLVRSLPPEDRAALERGLVVVPGRWRQALDALRAH